MIARAKCCPKDMYYSGDSNVVCESDGLKLLNSRQLWSGSPLIVYMYHTLLFERAIEKQNILLGLHDCTMEGWDARTNRVRNNTRLGL